MNIGGLKVCLFYVMVVCGKYGKIVGWFGCDTRISWWFSNHIGRNKITLKQKKGIEEGEISNYHCGIFAFKYYGHKLSHSLCHILQWQKECDIIDSMNDMEISLHQLCGYLPWFSICGRHIKGLLEGYFQKGECMV